MSRRESENGERDAMDETLDLAVDLADETLRAAQVLDVLEHIPVLKAAVAGAKIISSIRDQFLMRKILAFLRSLNEIPAQQRVEMIQELESDPDYRGQVGEHLIELLDRIEGERKARMVGSIFAAFARKEIELRMLRRLTTAVERIPVIDIRELRLLSEATQAGAAERMERFKRLGDNSVHSLEIAGLCTNGQSLGGGGYLLNNVGMSFLSLNLDRL